MPLWHKQVLITVTYDRHVKHYSSFSSCNCDVCHAVLTRQEEAYLCAIYNKPVLSSTPLFLHF